MFKTECFPLAWAVLPEVTNPFPPKKEVKENRYNNLVANWRAKPWPIEREVEI